MIDPRMLQDAQDTELLKLIRDTDESALEVLVERHEEKVFRLAARIVGNVEDARDIAQEVFIGIWENPGAWKPKAEFTTWLYRITFNRSLNYKRSRKLKSLFSLSSIPSEQIPALPDSEIPDTQLTRDEDIRMFENEFNRLHPRQKAALHLRYKEGLSVSDVAAALGISHKSAESLIFRGKQTLRNRLVK